MLHIEAIPLYKNNKDMEYSEDFKDMVKAHQGKFIGYGNPNAKILVVVPKNDDRRVVDYNKNNSEQWLANIENQTDFSDVDDFFAHGEQVGDETTFNPLHPFKGQRDVVRKKKDKINNDWTCFSWHRIQYLVNQLLWYNTDEICLFNIAFYTIFDEELLSDSYFQRFKIIMCTFQDEESLRKNNPAKLFGMKYYWGCGNKLSETQRMYVYNRKVSGGIMLVTVAYEKAWKKNLEVIKGYIDDNLKYWGIIDDTFV